MSNDSICVYFNLKVQESTQLIKIGDLLLIHKGQCVCVCVCLFVLFRNPNGLSDQDEIWHRGGP